MKKFTVLAALLPAILFAQSFEEEQSVFKDFYYSSFDCADFDGDGYLDVVFNGAIDSNQDGGVDSTFNEVYKSNAGTFQSFHELSEKATHLGDIQFIDFDNDGLLDIVSTGLSYNDITNYKQYRYKNTGSSFELEADIAGRIYSQIKTFDFNHDGKLDYAINGIQYVPNVGFSYGIDFFQNSSDGFILQPDWLNGTQNGDLLIADFNNDNLLDAAVFGFDANTDPIFNLYLNNQGSFELSQELPPMSDGQMSAADFNADGFLDFVVVGNDVEYNETLMVYFNDGNGNFTPTTIELEGLSGARVDTGDLNNDGYYDFIIIGNDANYDGQTKIFLFDPANSSFIKAENSGLFNLGSNGGVKLMDFNSDNHLDVLMNGFDWSDDDYPSITKLFKNTASEENLKPLPPTELNLEVIGNRLNFSWSGATDDKTPTAALQYELKVGSNPNGQDIAKYVVSTENWFLELDQIPENLYWSVKSIDASKAYSESSEQQTLSNQEIQSNDLKVYPNPAIDFVNIHSTEKIEQLELYSIHGQKMEVLFDGQKLNVSHLPSGIYIVKIQTNQSVQSIKLIKK